MNNILLQFAFRNLSPVACRSFSVSALKNKNYSCKLVVVGGGSGGCTIAAKLAKQLKTKDSVIVVEPSSDHYYQPLWTLVGAGVKKVADTRKDTKKVLPKDVTWIQDYASYVDPDNCILETSQGDCIKYEFIVIAVGLKNDYHKVPGLYEALIDPCSNVSTIYDPCFVENTWRNLQEFKGGDAIFTYPNSPIKCPGAPQKIAYLADSYFRKTNKRSTSTIIYNTCLPVIFGVKKYADELLKVIQRKEISVNYQTVLTEVRHCSQEAVFLDKITNKEEVRQYSLLHVTPPMSTPVFLSGNKDLIDAAGFLNVDKYTLQHVKYRNMFGLGDCTNTPNSKTAAAIAKQSYVLEKNLTEVMKNGDIKEKYDGYGACPLVTSYNTCILAEFLYDGVVHETLPFNQAKERVLSYYMKRDLFPFLYWNFMLKGNYNGPEFVRKIVNPFGL